MLMIPGKSLKYFVKKRHTMHVSIAGGIKHERVEEWGGGGGRGAGGQHHSSSIKNHQSDTTAEARQSTLSGNRGD